MTTPALNDDLVRAHEIVEAAADQCRKEGWMLGTINAREVLRAHISAALEAQSKEIEALRTALEGAVAAWDVLPGDRNYGPKVIENWVVNDLAPAFRRARTALKGA